jgi:hypothetical protein
MTWMGLCDEIFDLTQKRIRAEPLRQFAEGFARKDRPHQRRGASQVGLKILVEFLCHDKVRFLLPEELREPEIPRALARLMLEHVDPLFRLGISPHPRNLAGIYMSADASVPGADRQIELRLEVREEEYFVRASETTRITYRPVTSDPPVRDPRAVSELTLEGEGWGILTQEENVLLFMKNRSFDINYVYITAAINEAFQRYNPVVELALLRHQDPLEYIPGSFDELTTGTRGNSALLRFMRTNNC